MKEAGKWRELQSLVAHFLETSKLQLAHGYNTDLRFMAHLHEPLRWTYRQVTGITGDKEPKEHVWITHAEC